MWHVCKNLDKIFGEHLGGTAHLRSSSSSSICILFVRLDNFDLHHERQPWWYWRAAAAVPTFPVALYMLLISYLVLVMVLFADLLDVLACLYVVKLASAYVLLTSIIKLTQKLLNIQTICTSK
jgi:hypothetical protein